MSDYVGRYAPSPTGRLHLGNLRTALLAWLHCRVHQGRFILRIDDLDRTRCKPEAVQQIIDDLSWLGLDWDDIYYQSAHIDDYQEAFTQLRDRRVVYACRCSRRDIQEAQRAPHDHQSALRYPDTCRNLNLAADTIDMAWRLKLKDQTVVFDDLMMAQKQVNIWRQYGDFVVKRKDGFYAYQLACAVDEATLGITHIIRGADLVSSTFRQIAVMSALDLTVPRYGHVALMCNAKGEKLNKRDNSQSLQQAIDSGASAEIVLAQLAESIGLIALSSTKVTLTQLLDQFGDSKFAAI